MFIVREQEAAWALAVRHYITSCRSGYVVSSDLHCRPAMKYNFDKKNSVKISKKFSEPEKLKNATEEKRGIEIRSDTSVPSFLPRECIAKSTEMLYLTLYLPCFSASRANVLNETPMKRCCQKHLISL